MSAKFRYFLVIAFVMLLCIGLVLWLYVGQLPLPEGQDITGHVTRLDIVFDPAAGETTHETVSFDLTDQQVSAFLTLLQDSSYQRTLHRSSVSFDGEVTYTVSLTYQAGDRRETTMITILGNELINVLVTPDTSTGYLKIIDPDFLTRLQEILGN